MIEVTLTENVLASLLAVAVALMVAAIFWYVGQRLARDAEANELRRGLYQELLNAMFDLCNLEDYDLNQHKKYLGVLNRAWLYSSHEVLQTIHDFLNQYKEVRDAGDLANMPRDDQLLEGFIHQIYANMRKDLVTGRLIEGPLIKGPWYLSRYLLLYLFRSKRPIRGRVEFYQWTRKEYSGLRTKDQSPPNEDFGEHETS